MRILQVLEPGVDGVFRHVEGLVEYLLYGGHHVLLAYSDKRGSHDLSRLVVKLEAESGSTINLGVGPQPCAGDVQAGWRLRQFIYNQRPDVIHAHSSKAGALVRLPGLTKEETPRFYTAHAYYGMGGRRGVRPLVFNLVERLLANRATTVSISPDEAEFARTQLGVESARQIAVPIPVPTQKFCPPTPEQRATARAQFELSENQVALGTVGRLCFQKDPATLYKSLAPLLRRDPRLTFLHLGTGELETEVRQLCEALKIGDQVRRLQYLDEPAPFFHAIDGLVMTSRYEGTWPTVVLEALSSNLPLVVSLGPGMSGIDKAGLSHCWTAQPEDVSGFTEAIDALLKSLSTPREVNHRALALDRFSPSACYGELLDAYQKAANVRA